MRRQSFKRTVAILLAFVLCITVAVSQVSAVADYEWVGFGKGYDNVHITNAYTPIQSEEKWTYALKGLWDWDLGMSDIVIANDKIVVVVSDTLYTISKNGKLLDSVSLDGKIDYTARIVYVNGLVLIPLHNGVLKAINLSNLTTAWTTDGVVDSVDETREHQSLTTITVDGNYAYYGTAYADWTTSYSGFFRCVDITDGSIEWSYENTNGGYYWSGAAIYNDFVVFAGDDGIATVLNKATGEVVNNLDLGCSVRSTVIKSGNYLYVVANNGTLFKLSLSSAGKLKIVKSVKFADSSTCTPTPYNGKIYIGGSLGASGGYQGTIAVIKTSDLSIVSQYTTVADVKSAPLVSTAYDNVTVYFTANTTPGGLYALANAKVTEMFIPTDDDQNYCMANVISDDKGVLYYTNDSGKLFAVKPVVNPKITLSKSALTIGVGESVSTLKATVDPSYIASDLKWSSSNTSVATVNSKGVITGKKSGSATITAKIGDSKTTCKVCVKPAPKSVVLNKTSLTLGVGETVDLESKVNSGSASKLRAYTTSNSSVASVVKTGGLVTAKKAGTATITVTCFNGVKTTCKVCVKPAPKSVTLNKTSLTLGIGETFDLESTVNSGAAARVRNYTSSNSSVASVIKAGGLVTAKKTGTATITVTCYNGVKTTCKVCVKSAPKSVILNKTSLTLKVGQTFDLDSTVNSGAAARVRNYTSSNSSVASVVKAGGLVSAKKAGTTTITVTCYNGVKTTCKVTVKK